MKVDINKEWKLGFVVLIVFVLVYGNYEIVKLFLKYGVNLNYVILGG